MSLPEFLRDTDDCLMELQKTIDVPAYCPTWFGNPKEVRILRIIEEYIIYWTDESVQEFYYDVSPAEVLESLKNRIMYDEKDRNMEHVQFKFRNGKIIMEDAE